MTGTRIVFPQPECVALEEFELGALPAGHVHVRTECSLMSPGTEGIVLHRRFDEGTHWAAYAQYPFTPGYAAVGVVEAVGGDVSDIRVGERVATRAPHASEQHVRSFECTRVPDGLRSDDACWFALAKIALMGAHAARYRLGDVVAVIGAGPVGQMSLRWAAAAGARAVVAIDPFASRLDLARRGGATHAIADAMPDANRAVIAACGGRPRVVVDSTGNAAVLAAALGLVADRGRVVLIGDTGRPEQQHLTSDVVTRGVSIVGAHDLHSITGPRWDGDRSLHDQFFELVLRGRFELRGLNTHVFAPAQCRDAYATVDERPGETMGVVFDWRPA